MGVPFIGEIRPFAINYAPRGWALCDGSILSANENPALFSLLGSEFGGDGRTTFALPDLRGRTPVHHDPGSFPPIGYAGGSEAVTLTPLTMAEHTHEFKVAPTDADQFIVSSTRALGIAGEPAYAGGTTTSMATDAVSIAGGSTPHDNVQPFQTINYCIALSGAYPPRN